MTKKKFTYNKEQHRLNVHATITLALCAVGMIASFWLSTWWLTALFAAGFIMVGIVVLLQFADEFEKADDHNGTL